MSEPIILSAPGNLLLAGEYLVTRPGGPGLACAVSPRGTATIRTTPGKPSRLITTGSRRDEIALSFRQTENYPIVQAVLKTVDDFLKEAPAGAPNGLRTAPYPPENVEISIDTSSFFLPGGRKRGLGSSAVATVLLTAALLGTIERDTIFRVAVEAHRLAHRGRGSGYDIAASTYGGWGRFTGGPRPVWVPLTPGVDLPELILDEIPGPAAVSTETAVERFDRMITRQPELLSELLQEGSDALSELLSGPRWPSFRAGWERARQLGIRIGTLTGVSATMDDDSFGGGYGDEPRPKAVGAGNELFITPIPASEAADPARYQGSGLQAERDGIRYE